MAVRLSIYAESRNLDVELHCQNSYLLMMPISILFYHFLDSSQFMVDKFCLPNFTSLLVTPAAATAAASPIHSALLSLLKSKLWSNSKLNDYNMLNYVFKHTIFLNVRNFTQTK